MNKQNISFISVLLLILFIGTLLVSCGTSNTTPSATGSSSDGQTLMQERCSVCHSTDRITSAHKTADQWTTTVTRMISHGAKLNTQEQQTLIDYLAANYK
jgi:cytochrome c-type biogenesis protein CcmH/NrfF